MAVRPLVTTGVALVSAGAIVAGAPALFVPHKTVAVASPAAVEAHNTLTQQQIHLLALSLQGAWQSFTQGYGGLWFPGQSPKPAAGFDDGMGDLVDANGTPLYNADGTRATTADLEPGAQYYNLQGAPVYELDEDGGIVTEDDPGNCTADGAVCQDGFTGLAYYLSDNILPLGDIDNIFFEGGFTELAHQAVRTVAVAIDSVDPTGRLDLTRRVDDFFEGGATQLVGNLLLDNLPQDGYAYGLTNSFFFGYGVNSGITAAITYVVDAIAQGTPTPDPNFLNPLDGNPIQTFDTISEDTVLLAKTAEPETTTPTSTGLPNFNKLLSLPTPKLDVESSWEKLSEKLESPTEATLLKDVEVKDLGTVDENVEGGTEGAPVVEETKPEPLKVTTPKFELPKIEAPTFEAPKLPEAPTFEAPELDPPKLNLDLKPKPKAKIKEVTAKEEDDAQDAGSTDPKSGNKVAPPILFENGKPKGDYNGKKFLNKLKDAVDKATGGDKDSGDGGGDE
ncbi:hypothetical protein BA059_26240 [Mycolicibacterium sp. (ex Dasyatis americana)]|uniref:hypothetical protein n=1 Tax=Mycobacterium sp. DBP42 TaxID=2545267 RepID=UPI00087274BB|nr:hypothetical protein [Mycobacterium sp. DBP42]OFB35909.1 hypothetical protein BA059_26240 [Mycolicibacterium sp. (ex Dasyatis americana)]TMS52771.1 hypothetical protein E0T84_14965 [Mycobacterium sp. DBP42]